MTGDNGQSFKIAFFNCNIRELTAGEPYSKPITCLQAGITETRITPTFFCGRSNSSACLSAPATCSSEVLERARQHGKCCPPTGSTGNKKLVAQYINPELSAIRMINSTTFTSESKALCRDTASDSDESEPKRAKCSFFNLCQQHCT